jgi:hypothetical protein
MMGHAGDSLVAPFETDLGLLHAFALQDGAIIDRCVNWETTDKIHVTALGHLSGGDVWVYTVTKPREPIVQIIWSGH